MKKRFVNKICLYFLSFDQHSPIFTVGFFKDVTMFLGNLNKKEQIAFLELIKNFIKTVGESAALEDSIIELICIETGIKVNESERKTDLEKVISTFKSSESQKSVILELIGLAYNYNKKNYYSKKIAFVKNIAEKFGISEFEMKRMEKWVSTTIEESVSAYLQQYGDISALLQDQKKKAA